MIEPTLRGSLQAVTALSGWDLLATGYEGGGMAMTWMEVWLLPGWKACLRAYDLAGNGAAWLRPGGGWDRARRSAKAQEDARQNNTTSQKK